MKPLQRPRSLLLALLVLAASSAAQSTSQLLATTDAPAIVHSVRVLPGQAGPAVEILSSRPLVPAISKVENPPRLVIDLPNALVSGVKKRIDFTNDEINGIRVNQYQNAPPVTRVDVDLAKPVEQTWDAAGNRLMIRLRGSEQTVAKPPSVPVFTQGTQPVAVPLAPGTSGTVILAGSHIAPGSSVVAGSDTSVLRLTRGGEVLVCPGTTVSVTSSQNGNALMLGMSTGALEAHYKLDASADSIITPDFRILLAGPGEFHYAVSADARGNTCIQSLAGNTASVIVSELLGDGTYQVKPGDQIMLRSGQLKNIALTGSGACGCPAPTSPVVLASSKTPVASATPEHLPVSETAALPASSSKDVHVQVDAPFVFRGDEPNVAQPPAIVKLE